MKRLLDILAITILFSFTIISISFFLYWVKLIPALFIIVGIVWAYRRAIIKGL